MVGRQRGGVRVGQTWQFFYVGSYFFQDTSRSCLKEMCAGSNSTCTASICPVLPLHTSLYVGSFVVPCVYPTDVCIHRTKNETKTQKQCTKRTKEIANRKSKEQQADYLPWSPQARAETSIHTPEAPCSKRRHLCHVLQQNHFKKYALELYPSLRFRTPSSDAHKICKDI
jgi:hypothetical protein